MASRLAFSKGWKNKAVMLLLQLAPAVLALAHPRVAPINPAVAAVIDQQNGLIGNISKSLPLARQDSSSGGETPMGVDCLYLCTLATCGGVSCPFRRRNLRYSGIAESNETHSLRKRVFETDHDPWTPQQLDEYIVNNQGYYRPKHDDQFQDIPLFLINDFSVEMTVSIERKMGLNIPPFQIGTKNVHGCTVVTIASERAVWMAHFWEVSGMQGLANAGMDLIPGTAEYTNFHERVINPITGEGPTHGILEPLTRDLYNQSTDQTRAIIYTPLRFDWNPWTHGVKEDSWQYKFRVNDIVKAIQRALGTGVSIEVNPYFRLNYRTVTSLDEIGVPVNHYDGPDASLVDRNARGSAWFQYDGTYQGSYWRLFVEYLIYRRGDFQDIDPNAYGPE